MRGLAGALLPLLLATAPSDPGPLLRLSDPRIAEASALVAASDGSRLYTANDSGSRARVYVVDLTGRTVAVQDLTGVDPVDLEDAALGPGPALYLADVGDNLAVRPSVRLYVVPEPTATAAVPPRTVVLTYDDGARDAEALLVHPRTGQVLLVTKSVFGSGVYAAPQPLADGVLRRVGAVSARLTGTPGGPVGAAGQLAVTGGAVSADGRRIALRTYTDAYVYEVPDEDLVAALTSQPLVLPLPASPQGEGITWTRDGSALLTSSEGVRSTVDRVPVPAASAADTPSAAATPSTTPSAAASPSAAARPSSPAPAPRLLAAFGGGLLAVAGLVLLARRRG